MLEVSFRFCPWRNISVLYKEREKGFSLVSLLTSYVLFLSVNRPLIRRLVHSMTTSDNNWQRMVEWVTTNGNERQRVTANHEWQQIKASGSNKWRRTRAVKLSDFKFQNKTTGQSDSWRIFYNFLCNIYIYIYIYIYICIYIYIFSNIYIYIYIYNL